MSDQVVDKIDVSELLESRKTDEKGKANVKKMLAENQVEYVDLRFTDLRGKEHHVTLPQNKIDDAFFKYVKAFDGSSLCGFKDINE